MTIFEVVTLQRLVDGGEPNRPVNDRRYFQSRDAAIAEGQQAANIYAAMLNRPMVRHEVDRYGVVVAWEDAEREAVVTIYEGELELERALSRMSASRQRTK